MPPKNIVVIEDERDILEVLKYNLEREGLRVTSCLDGTEGLEIIQLKRPDLVLLDLMLPGLSGLDICEQLKSNSRTRNIPIIMVTAKGEEADVVLGLGIGADDYIAKPFSPRELIARVKAVLRRTAPIENAVENKHIAVGDLVIDVARHKVTIHEREVNLTATEFRILYYLASHPGRVYTRERILDQVLGNDAVVVDRNIDVHIRGIRKKIGADQDFISTIRGVGYRFREST